MKFLDQYLLEQAYDKVLNKDNSVIDKEIKECEDVIKKLAKGEFRNETEEVIDHVKGCESVFSVEKDSDDHYTVIIKDSALPHVEKMFPELTGKFKSAADCKKDVAKCREDKLKEDS